VDLVAGVAGWVVAAAVVGWAVLRARTDTARMEAVARATHELRGPITAARLGLQLLLRTAEAPAAALTAIELELSQAGLALEDLSRASAGGPVAGASRAESPESGGREIVDVAALLADCVEAARPSAAARGVVDLRWAWIGPAGVVSANRVRLAQAIGNLIANAIEHGEGEIEARGRTEAGTVRIEVLDRGRGLPAPVAELARRARRGRGARGRGLAIATAIATDHGGRLAAAPSDRGARLVLELPAAAGEAPAEGGAG
jgi:signal transduction histidine kinase